MLFNSYIYIFVFFPVVFFVYFFLTKRRWILGSKIWLVLASLFFYGWWNPSYLILILSSIAVNYNIGSALTKKTLDNKIGNKTVLILGIVFNLGLLGYFKYADFFIQNINMIFSKHIGALQIILPLAISFFTFQQISYLVDSYKGKTKEYDLLNYILFVTFFPQLIAGPIVHHSEMMPQFETTKNKLINPKNISEGLTVFTIGLFKKVIIADTFAIFATNGFDYAHSLTLIEAWVTSLSYGVQLYFDFSGYTDMAIGGALLFNIRLPKNFNSPYKARNIQDFWRRWHITLSRFLKDYVYIPLGGNRKGEIRTYINLILTFLIGGLWHGAGWTFIFWGFLHGIGLTINRIWQNDIKININKFLAIFITFNFVNIAWIFFRAKEWEDAIKVLKGMFGFSGVSLPSFSQSFISSLHLTSVKFGGILSDIYGNKYTIPILVVAMVIMFIAKNSNEIAERFKPKFSSATYYAILFAISILSLSKASEFLYFNF